jgi:hypothetical protein
MPPGKPLEIRLDHSVIQRINIEVMRGFGVTRRRGTETGGLLIGKIDRLSSPPVLHIQDFEVCPCEYASGPSYLLSANDWQNFKQTVSRWEPSLDRDLYAVGYFRSHTREGFALDENDASVFRAFFRDPLDVALLIKPFATRVAEAGIFLQDKGALAAESPAIEFQFTGRQKQPSVAEAVATPVSALEPPQAAVALKKAKIIERPSPAPYERPMFAEHHARESSGWGRRLSWFAFSLALLAFGGACGYEYAGARAARPLATAGPSAQAEVYSVRLQVSQVDSSLMVKWDRDSAPIQAAMHGVLTVTEGSNSKEVKLGFAELRNGTAMYPNVGAEVRFRLELFFKENRSFVESAEFRQGG